MKRMFRQSIGIFSSLVVALSPGLTPLAFADGISGTGPHGPEVVRSGNNTPLIMIETPNGAGVSHNTYDSFNVDDRGAILNNIDSNYGQTQLGGYVQGNSNLRNGAASIIINEVVTNNPSQLGGYLEVAGARADVVVANPYGITCDGCGFINTDHATLTTGKPRIGAGGALESIDVSRGHVTIGKGGLDATGVSQFDLLSRTVSFAGAIYGQNVRVVAGRNNIIYATGEVEVKGDDGGKPPAIAIDSTVLGGMYADKITIMSTERGAGVRAPETMAANAGEMHITADGRLVMGQASAKRVKVRSRSKDVVVKKQIYAAEQAEVKAARDLVIAANGQLVSEAALSLSAGRNMVMGDSAVAGSRQAGLDARIGGSLTAGPAARLIAAKNIGLQAGGLALGREALVSAGTGLNVALSGAGTLAEGAVMVSGDALSLDGAGLELATGAVVSSGAAANIRLDRLALNGGILQAAGDLALDSRAVIVAGGVLQSGGALEVNTDSLSGQDHVLAAANTLSLTADTIDLGAGEIVGGGDTVLRAGRLVTEGIIASRTGNLDIATSAGDLVSTGALGAAGDIMLASTGEMQLGHVQAGDALHIGAAGDVTGLDAFEASGMMEITTGGSLRGLALHAGVDVVARAVGDILIGDDPATAGNVLPHEAEADPDGDGGGVPGGDGDGQPDPGDGDSGSAGGEDGHGTTPPSLAEGEDTDGDGDFTITPGLRIGDVRAGRDIDLTAGGRIVIGNSAIAERDIRLDAGDLIDVNAVQLGGELGLQSGTGETGIGTLVVAGDFSLKTKGALNLGAISAPGSLDLRADSLTLGGLAAGSDIRLTAGTGDLAVAGDILSGGAVTLDAQGEVSAEKIVANAAIDISSGTRFSAETVQSGTKIMVDTGGDLTIKGAALAEQGVTLISGGQLSSGAVQALDGAVTLAANGGASITGAVISGTATDIRTGGNLELSDVQSGADLMLSAGGDARLAGDVSAAQALSAGIGGNLELTGTADMTKSQVLVAGTGLDIAAASLSLGDRAQLASQTGHVSLDIDREIALGRQASIVSSQALSLSGGNLRMDQESALHGRTVDMKLTGAAAIGPQAQIVGTQSLQLAATALDLKDDALISQQGTGSMGVSLSGALTSTGGVIQSAGSLDLTAGEITLTSSGSSGTAALLAASALTISGQGLQLGSGSVLQGQSLDLALAGNAELGPQAQIVGGDSVRLSAHNLDLGSGALIAQQGTGTMTVTTTGGLTSSGGVIQSAGDLTISAGAIALNSSGASGTAALLAADGLDLRTGMLALTGASAIQADAVSLKIAGATALGSGGQVTGRDSLALSADSLTLEAGALLTQQGTGLMTVDLEGDLTSNDGIVQSAGSLDISAAEIALTSSGSGTAALLARDALDVSGTAFRLAGASTVQGRETGMVFSGDAALGAGAQIIGRETLSLQAQNLTLGAGALISQQGTGVMTLGLAGNLTSTDGVIQSAGGLDLSASGITLSSETATAALLAEAALDLSAGALQLDGASAIRGDRVNLALTGDAALGTNAQIIGSGTFGLQAQNLTLGAGALISQQGTGPMSVDLTGNLTSTGGIIQSAGSLDVRATALSMNTPDQTTRAALLAEDALTLQAKTVTADATSLIQSNNHDLILRGQSGVLDITGGTWRAAGDLGVTAGQVSVSGGNFGAAGGLSIEASTGDLDFDAQANAAAITMQAAGDAAIAGRLTSPGAITLIAAGDLDHAGRVTTPGGLTLEAGGIVTDTGRGILPDDASEGTAQIGALNIRGAGIAATGDYLVAGAVDLTATGTDIHNTGQIITGSGLQVLAAGVMINTGTLEAASLKIEAGQVENRGLLAGAQSLDIIATGQITNAGTIASGSSLVLTSGGALSNQAGGEIAAHDGISQISATDLVNAGTIGLSNAELSLTGDLQNSGLLSANTSGTIAGTLDNTGQIQGGSHDLSIGALGNSGQFITEGSIILALNGGSVTNTGTLHAGGSLDISGAGMIRNSDGAEVSATGIRLEAQSLVNAGTIIAEEGYLIQIAGTARNAVTGLIQNGAAFTAAGDTLASRLTASELVNAGEIITDQGALIVTAQNSLSNRGQFSGRGTDSYLALHTDSLPDPGKIAAEGTLELANARGGLLTGLATEQGDEIVTEGTLIIKAARITNAGAIAGLAGLELEGNRLINTGVLYSGGSIALRMRDLIDNDGGLILAQDKLLVAGRGSDEDGNLNQLTQLTNRHGGVIQTLDGDMAFHVGKLDNLRGFTISTEESFDDTSDAAVSNNRGQWSFCADVGVDCSTSREQADGLSIDTDQFRIQSYKVSIDFQDAQPAQILSGGNISFTGGDILNQYSLISAAGDIGFKVDSVTNTGTETGERLRFDLTYDSDYQSISHHYAYGTAFGFTGTESDDQTDLSLYDPAGGVLGIISDPGHGLSYDDATAVRLLVEDNEVVLSHPGYGILDLRKFSGFVADPGDDRAGYINGSFDFTRADWGNFRSDWGFVDPGYAFGTIHAGGTVSGNVSGFVTNGSVAGGQVHRPGDSDEDFAVLAATNTRDASTGGALIGGDEVVTASMLSFTPDRAGTEQVNAGNREFTGKDSRLISEAVSDRIAERTGAVIDGGDARKITGPGQGRAARETALDLTGADGAGGVQVTGPGVPDDVALPGRAGIDLGVIGNDNLFVVSSDPSSEYLVESRYDFIDEDSFVSSDYFLKSLGYDPEETQQRLGDAMVETWLIRDQIFDLTGRNLLTGQGSEAEQLRAMYDNARVQAESLGLVPGVSLSADQVAALTSDIVWLETRVVSGRQVLVPQVYLTKETIRKNTHGGAQITGDKGISLNTGGLINSGGAIGSAGGQTIIAATEDIRNDAGLIFGGSNAARDPQTGLVLPSVALSADGDYLSTSGLVTGEDIVIAARDILITTAVTRVETAEGFADRAGPVAGLRASGNIGLNAGRDISLAGVEIAAGRDVTAIAGGNLTLGTVQLDAELGDTEGDDYDYFRATHHMSSKITAAGDISLISTGEATDADGLAHVTLAGSDLNAKGKIGIVAKAGDVNLISVADEIYSDRARSSSSAFGLNEKSQRDQNYDLSQNTVSLAGNAIDITAQGSVTAMGTAFTASGLSGQDAADSGNLRITATTGNIDFLAVENIHAEKHEKSSKTLGGLFSSDSSDEKVFSDLRGATVTTTGNLDLSAVDGSVLIQGGEMEIGGNLIATTDKVYLQGIIDTGYSFAHSNNNNGFVITDRIKVKLDETAEAPRITTGGRNGLLSPDGPDIHLGGRGDGATGNDQLIRGATIDALGPQAILSSVAGGGDGESPGDGTGDGGGEHWTTSLYDQYRDDASLTATGLADLTGPGTEYLQELAADTSGRVTTGDKVDLLNADYEQVTKQAGVLTKAAIAIASGALGGGAWLSFGLNAGADGIISGDISLEDLLKDAAFTAVSAGFDLGGGLQYGGVSETVGKLKLSDAGLFGSPMLSPSALANGLADNAVQSVVYGADFKDLALGGLGDQVINGLLATGQGKVGDIKGHEGSLIGVIGHGIAGCAASVAQNGDCAAGFVAGAGSEIATATLDRHYGGDNPEAVKKAMQGYVNPALAALTSGGDLTQYGTNSGIQNSQLLNNYLTHAQRDRVEQLLDELSLCSVWSESCSAEERDNKVTELKMLQDLSDQQTREMIKACSNGPSDGCKAHIDAAEGFEEWALGSRYNYGYPGYSGFQPSMFQASTGPDNNVENRLNLDLIALDYMRKIQNGTMTSEDASEALVRDLQSMDGRYKIVGGVIGATGFVACKITKISCLLGLISAIPAVDRTYEGVATAITGKDKLSAIELAARAAGVEDPEALRDDIENGIAIVTVTTGGALLVYKAGKFVANLGKTADLVIPPAGKGTVGGGNVATKKGVVDAVDASTPVGRRTGFDDTGPDGVQPDGSGRQTPQYETFDNLPINQPTTIGGRDYSGHALDQMQNRGATPSVVENTIKTGTPIPGNTLNEIEYVDTINGVNVVVDAATGRVVTVK